MPTPIIIDRAGERRTANSTAEDLESSRAERLERVERFASLLDEAMRIPGTNFRLGWDAIIGLIPGIGDVTSAALSAYVVHEAYQLGVSRWTLARMVGNIALDTVIGLVPFVGDFFDATFKANRANVRLLRKRLEAELRKR